MVQVITPRNTGRLFMVKYMGILKHTWKYLTITKNGSLNNQEWFKNIHDQTGPLGKNKLVHHFVYPELIHQSVQKCLTYLAC